MIMTLMIDTLEIPAFKLILILLLFVVIHLHLIKSKS